MGEGNKNGNKSGNKSDIREEIERLREVLAALDLGVEAANAALDRLQAKVEPEQQQRRGDETDEIKKGSKVKILSRNKEVWTTGQYVGQVAKVLRITPRCVWLKIPGRVDELRRNKEFVKLVKPN
jgi:signal recognition particle GTPase